MLGSGKEFQSPLTNINIWFLIVYVLSSAHQVVYFKCIFNLQKGLWRYNSTVNQGACVQNISFVQNVHLMLLQSLPHTHWSYSLSPWFCFLGYYVNKNYTMWPLVSGFCNLALHDFRIHSSHCIFK